jgi:hypothetical protein
MAGAQRFSISLVPARLSGMPPKSQQRPKEPGFLQPGGRAEALLLIAKSIEASDGLQSSGMSGMSCTAPEFHRNLTINVMQINF